VHWDRGKNKWRAQIYFNGKNKTLGWFTDAQKAQQAYVQAAKDMHGEFFCERQLDAEVIHG